MEMFNFAKTVPRWMNQSFFDKVIRHMEKDPQATVEKFNVAAGSAPGDSFSSAVYRSTITYRSKFTKEESKTLSFIIKAKLCSPIPKMESFLQNSQHFRNEMEMYGEVLPEVQSLWLSVGDKDLLCPKLIYQSNEPVPVIVLEDFSVLGFSVVRQPPVDLEVSKQIVRRLAKFHAATFYLHHEQKLDYNKFSTNLYQNPIMAKALFEENLEAFIDVAKNWDGFERFIPNLESFKKTYLNKGLKTYRPNCTEFGYNVLNHADFHTKNMLFKKNADETIEDFIFIDYQICIYATPAIDLIYALYFSVSAENRQQHRAELIAVYHQQFSESLLKFGYAKTPPSLSDLQVEMQRNGNLEVCVAICIYIHFFVDIFTLPPEDIDMSDHKKTKRKLYSTPSFMETILKELPRFLSNGFIRNLDI